MPVGRLNNPWGGNKELSPQIQLHCHSRLTAYFRSVLTQCRSSLKLSLAHTDYFASIVKVPDVSPSLVAVRVILPGFSFA